MPLASCGSRLAAQKGIFLRFDGMFLLQLPTIYVRFSCPRHAGRPTFVHSVQKWEASGGGGGGVVRTKGTGYMGGGSELNNNFSSFSMHILYRQTQWQTTYEKCPYFIHKITGILLLLCRPEHFFFVFFFLFLVQTRLSVATITVVCLLWPTVVASPTNALYMCLCRFV